MRAPLTVTLSMLGYPLDRQLINLSSREGGRRKRTGGKRGAGERGKYKGSVVVFNYSRLQFMMVRCGRAVAQ